LPAKQAKDVASGVKASYVTLNKDGKPVWEPGLRAEITSRRQPRAKRKAEETEEPPISCDLKATLSLSPEARSAWLAKALGAIPKGRAKAQEVFDIVTHRKFASGAPDELGQAMLRQVKESLMFFTEKQQLGIAKSKLVKDFRLVDPSRKGSRRRHDDCDSSDDRSFEDEGFRPQRRQAVDGDRRREHEDDFMARRGRSVDAAEPHRESRREPEQEAPPIPPEERARMEREHAEREAERQRKREQELRRMEMERKANEERERQRKAKIGSAFLMGGDDDDDEPAVPLGRVPVLGRRREDALRLEEEPLMGGIKFVASPTSGANTVVAASASSAIQTMGGDSIVSEAQEILQRGAGAFLAKKERERKGSRSRSRKRRRTPSKSPSRSRDRKREVKREVKGDDRRQRTWDSLRSPTPDGHLRGQMRAARKAKMMAQMLQQGNVPRVA